MHAPWVSSVYKKKDGVVIYSGNINKKLILDIDEVSNILRKQLTIKGVWNSTFKSKIDNWKQAEKFIVQNNHLDQLIKEKGNHGLLIARKHISWSCKNFPGAIKLRNNLMRAENVEEVKVLINDMISTLKTDQKILL